MKIFFLLFFIGIFLSIQASVTSVKQDVDWNSYIKNHFNDPNLPPYQSSFSPNEELYNATLALSSVEWEQISDTTLIRKLKTQEQITIQNPVNLYNAASTQNIVTSIYPFREVNGIYYRIKSFTVDYENGSKIPLKSAKTYTTQSVLSSGNWIRVATTKAGVVKMTYSALSGMGIGDPSNVAVYSNGGYMLPKMNNVDYPDDLTRIPVLHGKDKDGQSCIFFYSTGSTKWTYSSSRERFLHSINLYTDSTYFYLSSDVTKSAEPYLAETPGSTSDTTITTYYDCTYYEKEAVNFIEGGRRWFGDIIPNQSKKSFSFDFLNAISGGDAKVTIAFATHCFSQSEMICSINSSFTDTINVRAVPSYDDADYATIKELYFHTSSKSSMKIDLKYLGSNGDSWLDYISLNINSTLKFNSDQLIFRTPEILPYNTVRYNISNSNNADCILWDITEPLNPMRVSTSTDGSKITFVGKGQSIHEYVLFDPSNGSFPEPRFSSKISNQNLHGLEACDMIIVTNPNFIEPAERLANFHLQNDNLKVTVVTTTDIYNEFSSGLPDLSGIRNMLRMFYNRYKNTNTPLKYLLLMGDGSYDNRTFDGSKNNFIPTWQAENSINNSSAFVTDDFYGLLDDNEGESTGLLDIGIGRIPCATADEANDVIDKIVNYTSCKTLGNWRNNVCFVADDEDIDFMQDSEDLINLINNKYPGFYTKKIYLDSYQQTTTSGSPSYPDVNAAIDESINEGALIVNYIGHGNPQAWAHEQVLTSNDINSWSNSLSLPLFITATCEFGRFDQDAVSAAEKILLNTTGGGIALFTTTRPVYASNNYVLSTFFYSNIFVQDSTTGEKLRLGDVMKNAKNSTNDSNKLSFTLLADPALRLAFPKYKARTLSINGTDITKNEVAIGALDKVTIKGEVTDPSGSLLTTYNGEISTIVYDKTSTVETLGNDGMAKFSYPVQNNIIYSGISSVTNGEFELSFIVPKDISYNIGSGKIIYYTSNDTDDGNGSTTKFNIGGSGSSPLVENDPPEMELYLNNKNFKPNDNVSSSSLLLVDLYDESGINTVGTGIGHDLIAVLDDDYINQIVLNSFYTSATNNYQMGQILYPLTNLSPGKHKIWVKVWDVQNNSSEKEIYFTVEDGFKVTNVQNVPNPVSSVTNFEITHNLPGEVFDVTIDIYNLQGRKLHRINESVNSSGTTTIGVSWSIYQTNYPIYNNQWLVYRVTLTSQEGLKATGAGKILIKMDN